MQKQYPLWIAACLSLSLMLWSACKKSDFENLESADHTAEFAFPLFTTDLLLKDLLFKLDNDTLSNDTIFVNPDNTITLFYSGDVAQKPASDIFNFLQFGVIPFADSSLTNPIDGPAGVSIRVADLNGGTIGFYIKNLSATPINGYFEIPQMSLNGVTSNFPFPTLQPGQFATIGPIDLNGYHLASNNNTITFKYFAFDPDGVRVLLPTTGWDITAIFNGLKFSYVEGDWGYQSYQLTRDTIEIDINQTELKGDIKVKDPKVTMRVYNSWGFPTRGVIKYLSFIGQNGEEIPLESTFFQTTPEGQKYVDFAYPAWPNEVGQTKYTDITLNGTNSNIADIFNAQPVRLVYEVDGVSNANSDPNLVGFITDKSVISLQLRVELVLEGAVRNFGAEQTLNLDFSDIGSLDSADIDDVEFKLVTENGTPISSNAQIYFRDAAQLAIDSLFLGGPQDIIRSAPVNSEGVATDITRTETFIPMSAERFERIRGAKDAFLKTAFTSANDGQTFVKLLATDKIVIKMGLKVHKRL